jgi:hypothetical protein
MKTNNPPLPPTHPENSASFSMLAQRQPREIDRHPTDRPTPSADETMITVRLPGRPWAEALIRVARFFTIMDKLAEQLEREGDHLYMADVHPLARRLLVDCNLESLLVAEVLLAAEPTETGLSVLHSAQCDADEHGPDGNCHWRRNLRTGHFALL